MSKRVGEILGKVHLKKFPTVKNRIEIFFSFRTGMYLLNRKKLRNMPGVIPLVT